MCRQEDPDSFTPDSLLLSSCVHISVQSLLWWMTQRQILKSREGEGALLCPRTISLIIKCLCYISWSTPPLCVSLSVRSLEAEHFGLVVSGGGYCERSVPAGVEDSQAEVNRNTQLSSHPRDTISTLHCVHMKQEHSWSLYVRSTSDLLQWPCHWTGVGWWDTSCRREMQHHVLPGDFEVEDLSGVAVVLWHYVAGASVPQAQHSV